MKKPSIDELEAALADGDGITILPDGTFKRERRRRRAAKPITFRQNLGAEYGL